MGTYNDRVVDALSSVTGPLCGENLLSAFKVGLINEVVFKKLFGDTGERIFVDKLPSYNDKIVPLIELWWKSERYQSRNTRLPGTILGRIVLPPNLDKNYDPNFARKIAAAFQRYIGSDAHGLLDQVPGLIEFGVDANFDYSRAVDVSGLKFPSIEITIPVLFDLRLLQRRLEDINFAGPLDSPEFGLVETYAIKISDEESKVLIPEGTLSVTEQTNDN